MENFNSLAFMAFAMIVVYSISDMFISAYVNAIKRKREHSAELKMKRQAMKTDLALFVENKTREHATRND